MIYTSYFGNLKNLSDKYIPISIARWTPKWYKGLRYSKLAPNLTLLTWWRKSDKTQKDKDFYKLAFLKHLTTLNPHKIALELNDKCNGKIPVLICFEKPGDFCHRHIVAEWFRANRIKCEEIKN